MTPRNPLSTFRSSKEDAVVEKEVRTPQTESPSYKLSYTDIDFLTREELRPVRLQLELLKPELLQIEHGIEATIVMFGSSRIPDKEEAQDKLAKAQRQAAEDPDNETLGKRVVIAGNILKKCGYYEEARKLSALVSNTCLGSSGSRLVVVTGGGPGIMEAANRGAHDIGAKSIGFNIVLPHEQAPNAYISPDLCFQFHYFSVRKMQLLMRAQALVVFPGGFGTMDELFETLTLIQTKKIVPLPVLLFGREFWTKLLDFDFLVSEGVISEDDLKIFTFVETAEEAADIIRQRVSTK